ncbi:MAG: late promoter transcription accessory protein [Methylococcales bacterium]
MEEEEQLTDSLVITKRFRSPTEFSLYIDEIVSKFKISYMDAVINYCNEKDIDVDSIGPLVNQKLREKIQMEAENANMIKPRGHLPV